MSDRPFHLVAILDRYPPIVGGAQIAVHRICSALVANHGMRVTVLTRALQPGLKARETIDGVEVIRFGGGGPRQLSKIKCTRQIVGYVTKHRGEIDALLGVPISLMSDLLPAAIAAKRTGLSLVVRATAMKQFDAMLAWRSSVGGMSWHKLVTPPPLWRWTLRSAERIVAQSQPVLDRIAANGLTNGVLCEGGVDTHRFRPAPREKQIALRQQLDLPTDKTILVHTGRYVEAKNQMGLIRAVEALPEETRSQTLTVIIGASEANQSGGNEQVIKQYVEERELGGLIRFVDNAESVEDYLRAGDIYVFNSYFDEGLSNALLEAMACGLALVCSDLPQVVTAVPDEAIVTPRKDDDAVRDALDKLIRDAEERQRRGQAIGQAASDRFSLDRVVATYAEILRSASGS